MFRSRSMEGSLQILFGEFSQCRKPIVVSAPGRADFLNTHQDYKGLPVIPVAIKLRCYSAGVPLDSNIVKVKSVNLREAGLEYYDEFSINGLELKSGDWFGNYVRAVFKAFINSGFKIKGCDIVVWSEVPIGAGLSSSAALEVSIGKLLSEMFNLDVDKKTIAELSYKAEHDIMGIPCGRLDQYASSFGGIIKIDTRPPYNIEELRMRDLVFIISDSGEHRRTASIHPARQAEINQALKIIIDEVKPPEKVVRYLSYDYYGTRWEFLIDILEEYLTSLPSKLANRIRFTLLTHRSTLYAISILRGEKPSYEKFLKAVGEDFAKEYRTKINDPLEVLGAIMNYQHILLRDLYEVSTPRIEELRSILLGSGAIGAKISGAGMGGAVIALSKNIEDAEKIKKECYERGFTSTWVSKPEEGVRREKLNLHVT